MKHWDYFSLCSKRLSGEISAEENAVLDEWLSLSPRQPEADGGNNGRLATVGARFPPGDPGRGIRMAGSGAVARPGLCSCHGPLPDSPEPAGLARPFFMRPGPGSHGHASDCPFWHCFLFDPANPDLQRPGPDSGIREPPETRGRSVGRFADPPEQRLAALHPARFTGEERKVTLSGQAFFDVAHGYGPTSSWPRLMPATTVLGTRVSTCGPGRAAPGSSSSRAGWHFLPEAAGGTVILTRNRMSCGRSGRQRVRSRNRWTSDRLLGWLEGRLVFDRAPVPEVLAEIGRTFDVTVDLDDAALAKRTVTADFEHPNLETVLSSLCLTLNAKVRKDSGKYILYTG